MVGRKREAPRMGRPAGPPENVRRNRLTLLFTDAELAALEALARRRGRPVGTAAHELVTRALGRARRA